MKNALVTGASEGIGLAVVHLLATRGYAITIVARSEAKLKKVVQTLQGANHKYLVADLSDDEDLNKIVQHITTTKYDVLINNAGVGKYGRFIEMGLGAQLQMIKLNINAVVILSYHFLITSRRGDAIINTGSNLGIASMPGAAVYAATKAFVTTFSESLWHEAKRKGVYVAGFNPGPVKNEFHLHAGGDDKYFPNLMMQETDQVARELVRTLEKRNKPRTVSGAITRFLLFTQRLISRKAVVRIMGKFSPVK